MAQDAEIAVYGGPQARTFAAAFRDLYDGSAQYQYWHYSALNDLRARYRRSALGEWWIGINLAIFVLSVGFFYGALLNLDPRTYLPYLFVGYAFWLLLSTLIVEGCHAFIANGALLRQRRMPLTVIVLRTVDRAFMTLAHNLVVLAVALLLLGVVPTAKLVWFLPALALWWLNAMWLVLALGIICARFRDVPPAVLSIVQLLFLISPILWRPEDVPQKLHVVATFNPVSHYLAIVRDPLLGMDVPLQSWAVTLALTLAGWAVAAVLLRVYRTRVVYWV